MEDSVFERVVYSSLFSACLGLFLFCVFFLFLFFSLSLFCKPSPHLAESVFVATSLPKSPLSLFSASLDDELINTCTEIRNVVLRKIGIRSKRRPINSFVRSYTHFLLFATATKDSPSRNQSIYIIYIYINGVSATMHQDFKKVQWQKT